MRIPTRTMLAIANGGGLHPARNVVGGDFIHLVRLGIRFRDDPSCATRSKSSITFSSTIFRTAPAGVVTITTATAKGTMERFRRHRCRSIVGRFSGERGHYELAAGRDPIPFIAAIEEFSNHGGMLTEQVWDGPDLPQVRMKRGCPTGAAMPLCWSHASCKFHSSGAGMTAFAFIGRIRLTSDTWSIPF